MSRSQSSQFLVAEKPLTGGVIKLNESESHHARSVRRLAKGDEVRLSDGAGNLARGVLVDVPRQGLVEVLVEDAWHSEPRTPKITVIQALVSGVSIDDSIAMMTELGVDCFMPWVPERSQNRAQNVTNRWRKVASEATKQSGRAWLPEVSEPKATVDLEPVLADLDLVLVGDSAATLNVGQVSFGNAKSLGLVVGPEGGLTPSEMDFFGQLSAVRVSFGPIILRSVTAGIALVAALQTQVPNK